MSYSTFSPLSLMFSLLFPLFIINTYTCSLPTFIFFVCVGISSDDDHHYHHHLMDKENLFNFSHHFPYKFPYSPYSTESESNDEYVAILTQRFSRSTSLHQPIFTFKVYNLLSSCYFNYVIK